jgi:hypothetical protein
MSAHDDELPPTADIYLIWSHEHHRWWGPGFNGYVQSFEKAGRYTHREALVTCARAIPGNAKAMGALPELPVRLSDMVMLRVLYRSGEFDGEREPWE